MRYNKPLGYCVPMGTTLTAQMHERKAIAFAKKYCR